MNCLEKFPNALPVRARLVHTYASTHYQCFCTAGLDGEQMRLALLVFASRPGNRWHALIRAYNQRAVFLTEVFVASQSFTQAAAATLACDTV
jgi:hypothetical protein